MPALLMPRAAGVDISDSSIKWLALVPAEKGYRVQTYGDIPIKTGIVINGVVKDGAALAAELSAVKKAMGGIQYAHAALPEEAAYVFSMLVPGGTPRAQVLSMIEFEFEGRVPIPPSAAVFDYSIIGEEEGHDEISVVVFPREIADAYVTAFTQAGITLLSLEVEARSIARAVCSSDPAEPITLLIDFGRARTGFAVVKRGVPIFTSTVEVGGDLIDRLLVQKLSMSRDDVERFKNDEGLLAPKTGKSAQLEAVSGAASALADEVARHYHYWDTRRNDQGERVTPVGAVVLVGGNANLRGLTDYVAARVQAKTMKGNVWRHVASFEDYIPPIDKHNSLQYATSIGLALRGLSL
jgi:type IV pilus assembly protein PilM